ncbi:hypothetical protein HI914_07410 [Erysiphe necator]|nr:hypothetical protein HI914_07410 [Erysiphe necator]
MKHEIILGRMWFEKHGVTIDCRNRQLIYLDDKLATPTRDIPMDENAYQARNPEWSDNVKVYDNTMSSKNQIQNPKVLIKPVDNGLPPYSGRESEKGIRRSKRILSKQKNKGSTISELK